MSKECYLTTFDNPYNPKEQFNNWFLFDVQKGYNCCSKLARFANISDGFTDEENNREIENAIDEIIRLDFTDTYTKFTVNT